MVHYAKMRESASDLDTTWDLLGITWDAAKGDQCNCWCCDVVQRLSAVNESALLAYRSLPWAQRASFNQRNPQKWKLSVSTLRVESAIIFVALGDANSKEHLSEGFSVISRSTLHQEWITANKVKLSHKHPFGDNDIILSTRTTNANHDRVEQETVENVIISAKAEGGLRSNKSGAHNKLK